MMWLSMYCTHIKGQIDLIIFNFIIVFVFPFSPSNNLVVTYRIQRLINSRGFLPNIGYIYRHEKGQTDAGTSLRSKVWFMWL